MKMKMYGLISLLALAVPGLALADSFLTPWGAMNELGIWDAEDIAGQTQQAQPQYPTRPTRTLRERQLFSRPINRASVDINARLSKVPVFLKSLDGVAPYDIQVRALTPEYPAMSVIGYRPKSEPPSGKPDVDLTCEIESMRRWDRANTRGWSVRFAATFYDKTAEKLLEKANTLLMAHGVCYPSPEEPGQPITKRIFDFHAAFVSQFEDTDQAAVMMEIGTGLHFNTAGNGYLESQGVEVAFTGLGDREEVRINYR